MGFYSNRFRKSNRCAAFARSAVLAEFRPGDARALDYEGFVDRRPCDQPVLLGDVAAEVAGDVGRAALLHWIREAAQAQGEECGAALEIAKEIAGMIGVPWSEVLSEAT